MNQHFLDSCLLLKLGEHKISYRTELAAGFRKAKETNTPNAKVLTGVVECAEFLDKTDRSLAFAVFGAAQYDNFPVAVLPVSLDELLLCFDGLSAFFCCRCPLIL